MPTKKTHRSKSRSGCITCKIRKIKCDEARPQCKRCTSSHRECDGYLPQPEVRTARELREIVHQLGIVGPVSRALSRSSPDPPNEDGIYFDLFRRLTASSAEAFLPSSFWTRDVLQITDSEPAVWHAAVSLGALHRQWDFDSQYDFHASGSDSDYKRSSQELASTAMNHYGRAISHARAIREPSRLLVLSVMLQAIANVTGKWSQSQMHGLAGLRLLNQCLKSSIDHHAAVELLERLDVQAMLCQDSQAPYPFGKVTSPDLFSCDPIRWPSDIEDYPQAVAVIFTMIRRYALLGGALGAAVVSAEEYYRQRSRLSDDFTRWNERFSTLDQPRSCDENYNCKMSEKEVASLIIYRDTFRLLLEANLFGPESRWDGYLSYFERILSNATTVAQLIPSTPESSISFEPAIITPLFLTAFRCRHPQVRRGAIKLLRSLKRREAMWTGSAAAAVAERVMKIEEAGADRQLSTPSSNELAIYQATEMLWVPESKRVREIVVCTDFSARKVQLTMLMTSTDENNLSEATNETVLI
ncbi:hypothetical protein F5B20DRAFT_203590 [Whalleya microplaca]|nr:hypothetical protein F5B20DRAFT_203590 [Whalleya microplaca]